MAARRRGGGKGMNMIIKIILIIVGAGFVMALMRAFNYDVFGIIDWIWRTGVNVISWVFNKPISGVADTFSGNESFQNLTKAPK